MGCDCLTAIALQSENFGGGSLAVKQKVRLWPLSIALSRGLFEHSDKAAVHSVQAVKGAGRQFWKTVVLTCAGRGTAGRD